MKEVADTLGIGGVFIDPLWRVRVRLTELEQELLDSWWVRRLGFVNHAGAATITTVQSYSRLEHSLGLLALVAHFTPEDHVARAAALLHDVGHLPFSHTFEGVAGLDHHHLGEQRIHDLAAILVRHGLTADVVVDTAEGRRPSALHGAGSALRLDHLESFVRSGRAHGRTLESPASTLTKIKLIDGAVDTDAATAGYIRDLIVGEARSHTSSANAIAVGVMRAIATRILETASERDRVAIAGMTDDQFWALLLAHPETATDAQLLRSNPKNWHVDRSDNLRSFIRRDGNLLEFHLRRLYLDVPLVDGQHTSPIDPGEHDLPHVPIRFLIARRDKPGLLADDHPTG